MLLQITARKKCKSATQPANQNVFNRELLLFRRCKIFIFLYSPESYKRNENDSSDKSSYAVKCKCTDTCTFALGNERETPDNCSKDTVKRTQDFFLFDMISLQNTDSEKPPTEILRAAKNQIILLLLLPQLLLLQLPLQLLQQLPQRAR